jgi:excinuclease ABC subunit B
VLYADYFTESMVKALWETYRRRHTQEAFNTKHGIVPMQATSNVKDLESVKTDDNLDQDFGKLTRGKVKKLKRLTKVEKAMITKDLKQQLDVAIAEWRFEDAAIIRDQIKELEGD